MTYLSKLGAYNEISYRKYFMATNYKIVKAYCEKYAYAQSNIELFL